MDKKWWDAEARLCFTHGFHTLAQCAENIGNGVKQIKSREERAKEELKRRERIVRATFTMKSSKRLIISVKPKIQEK